MYTQADPVYPMAASSAFPVQSRCSSSMSRYEAELDWESERQKLQVHIASLPSSSFEKTKLEDEEYFYATFPEARQAAITCWIADHYPFAPWAQSQVAAYQDSIDITYDLSPAPCAPTSLHVPTPTTNFTTYTLGDALTLPPSPPCKASRAPTPPIPTVHYDYSNNAFSRDTNNSPNSIVTADTTFFSSVERPRVDKEARVPAPNEALTPPEDDHILRTLHLLAPARRSRKNTRKSDIRSPLTSRNQKNTYPSTSPPSSRMTLDTPSSSPTPSRSLPPKPTIVPSNAPVVQPRYTGDWEADAIATDEYLHSVINIGKKPSVSISIPALPLLPIEPHLIGEPLPPRRHQHPSRRAPRQRPRPYSVPPRSRSPSRERSRSTSPLNKRPKMLRDKNGKPIMACLFCRGRKIACGPPPKGSSDPTCNQCARRGLECQYPTINRRGMRKKKPIVHAYETSSETSSPSSTKVLGAALELVKIGETISISDYSDDSASEWDGDY